MLPLKMLQLNFFLLKKKKKEICVVTEIHFALLAFKQNFVWPWGYIVKQNIPCQFLFNIEIIHPW